MKNMLSFEPQLISEDEMQNRLKNSNTEEIFVPECLNFRYGNLGFICNNQACTGLYCVNNISEIPDSCIYCKIKKRSLTLLIRVTES
jgi:hypothetical protein